MLVLSPPGQALKFDLGLVPGVALGAFLSAALWRELKLEGFQGGQAMRRYIAGAMLMGFGGMLARRLRGGRRGPRVRRSVHHDLLGHAQHHLGPAATLTDWLVERPREAAIAATLPEVAVAPGLPFDPEASASYARP